ncbi:S-layer homology domain-containing protein, partial [Paenibacillus sepulcri]|nr:S-layer homology domain-containing protein [Paenibacillus sepulcri]
TAAGTFSFIVKAQNAGGSATQPLSIVISAPESQPPFYWPSTPVTEVPSISESDGNITVKGNSAELTIPKLNLEAAADSEAPKSITVEMAAGTVTFPEEAVAEIAKQAGGQDVKLSMSVTKPDEKGDVTVSLTLKNSDGKQITPFAASPVTVSVPYTLADGRHPDAVIAKNKGDNAVLRGHYDPDTKKMIFTTKHFSDFLVTYNLVEFSDVPKTSKLYDSVVFLAARGITQGVGGSRFDLDSTLTRKEMLVSLMRIMDIAPDKTWTDNFKDAGKDYAAGYLAAAKRLGISKGNNAAGTTFGGNLNVNVSEFYQFLYNALQNDLPAKDPKAPALTSYSDYADIPAWAMDATKVFAGA